MPNPVHQLDDELRKLDQLRMIIGEDNLDDDEILGLIEGETNITECLDAIDDSIIDDEIQLGGIKAMLEKLEMRQQRYKRRIENKRRVILKAMEHAGLRKHTHAGGTLFLSRVAPKVVIFEEAAIPDDYWVQPPPKLDKKLIKQALDDGHKVAGAGLDNGSETLTIRRS